MFDAGGLRIQLNQEGPIPLDVDLTCRTGELVALVGPSGGGKSTILRSVAGLYRPVAGRVVCQGVVWHDTAKGVWLQPHLRRVGMVFQSYALFPHMTALGNVEAGLLHLPLNARRERARALLRQVHLEGVDERKPSALSGGQQQRVAVARALARDPDVLLLDEPFSAVDRRTRRRLHGELSELRAAISIPIILVTHDLHEASNLADRLYVLDRGMILQSGTPIDVLAAPADDRVRYALDIDAEGQAPSGTLQKAFGNF